MAKNYVYISVLLMSFLAGDVSLGHAQRRIETEAIKSTSDQIIRDAKQKQQGFFYRIRMAIQDLRSKLRRQKGQAAQNDFLMDRNRANAKEATARAKLQQREANARLKDTQAQNREKMRAMRERMRP